MEHEAGSRWSRLRHEQRVLILALAAGLPATAFSLFLLWTLDFSSKVQWTLSVVLVLSWIGFSFALREHVERPLQTLSNLLGALREGDYSIRARGARGDEALGLALLEANTLGQTLREQRLDALEATNLLAKVMAEIDVAVFAFDGEQRLRLVNRAGERLLAQPQANLNGLRATELGLGECLEGDPHRIMDAGFPIGHGRWEIRRSTFRQGGLSHHLLVVSDLSRTLREEERQAWQRLVRVLGHEINNSLAPIKSIAGSLRGLVDRKPLPRDWDEDVHQGLDVISGRAESLSRFMASYARLTRLPPPTRNRVEIESWVRRVVDLETRLSVDVKSGPDLAIQADGDQLDQLLINLVRNAVDAVEETGGGVEVGWESRNGQLALWVSDEGPGLPDTTNLFVPFYTTKPDGSGIGLALSRQIAESHGGSLTLTNREPRGCTALLILPQEDAA
jgi:nitrogen fixation/metabolism regulation signal transduction histidine kinase